MDKSPDEIETAALIRAKVLKLEPEGTFLIFGDGDDDSVFVKVSGDMWASMERKGPSVSETFGDYSVSTWIESSDVPWSLS